MDPFALAEYIALAGEGTAEIAAQIFDRPDIRFVVGELIMQFEVDANEGEAEKAARTAFYLAWERPEYMTRFLTRSESPPDEPPVIGEDEVPEPVYAVVEAAVRRAARIKSGEEKG